ncbi:hypothetical protein D3C78_1068630 [compost metagenome]
MIVSLIARLYMETNSSCDPAIMTLRYIKATLVAPSRIRIMLRLYGTGQRADARRSVFQWST